ncbi:MAG: sulfotransferase family protein [Herpetosiphon sp.]
MTIRVIGAGFGRTGTASLKLALETLGFGQCYHMSEIFDRPADARVWDDAAIGNPVDWDALFTGYQATVDWPGCTFYRELMEQYPAAKVILTVRDAEMWHKSAMQTIYKIYKLSHSVMFKPFRYVIPAIGRIATMQDHVFWEGTFHGRFPDKAFAMEVFNQHNEEVKRFVPAERLLVYEVREGWEPLCTFLDVPVPAEPFPHVNDTAEFQQRITRFMGGMVAGGLLVGGLLLLGWRWWRRQ